ncbi:UDP-glucose 6-dehydrogenase [Rhodonellum psychrophilum GCM71 = DSM 17998]|uniref:UDP-glucose 6-dehydrogenase n=2 Tax=Rhodonellum TaxID=336827 RepID=U5C1M0_9BACT|nr:MULTISPECIES: UDP-glucose/GDP-mannose dehydrogenase family protein [Rhodonellum]ERM83953.1 UDP-glucose 6-dehydrogenase [Rhodonellum psychrophilum GCM71 = DSM 17998]MDO9551428.1 UDP-glucose/GDP-mannose dehydrogenase family protein [Rhodonellum sp.]SDZ05443.1 UDP-glucose dehydrogenase [Rhodonellum ikkaensis]
MKITVVGTGYVGLVSGACFSDVGIEVVCVDIDQKKIEGLRNGIMPIYEPGLEGLVNRNYKSGRLQFSTNLAEAIQGSDVAFIAVGTPPGEDGSADLKFVLGVAEEIGRHMTDYIVVATKSTVPVTTGEKVRAAIKASLEKRGVDLPFAVASNPEFLKEGAAIEDFLKPDRIVIGVDDEKAEEIMKRLYKPFQLSGDRLIYMDIPSAEMTKYASNAMLATKISFMNDIANLCELVGANVNMVRKGIGTDQRIGNKFIYPGVGYGGSCFPKDVKAIVKTGKQYGYELKVLQAVEEVNEAQKHVLVNKIKKHFGEDLSGMTFAMWGLSFKPNTDDMREAPAVVIIEELIAAGAKVKAYDPVAMKEAKAHYVGDKVTYCKDAYDACVDADALLLVTEWSEFRIPSWEVLGKLLTNKVVFDGRNIYDREYLKELGFQSYGIGVN